MPLKIGQLARRAGITVRALHHYDAIGLLVPSGRSAKGFRLYSQADVVRLHAILTLRDLDWPLHAIRAALDSGGADPGDMLARQEQALDGRIARLQAVRARIGRLRERLASGQAPQDDWLNLLELMALLEKGLEPQALDSLRRRGAARGGGFAAAWRTLGREVEAAVEQGAPPEGPRGESLARRWLALARETSGNDPGLAVALKALLEGAPRVRELSGWTPGLGDWIAKALECARGASLARRLAPEELEAVRARQAANRDAWPPLLGALRRCLERGASRDDPEARRLAGQWEALFEAGWSGGDQDLARRIRQAFREDPELHLGLGVDKELLALVHRAAQASPSGGDALPEPPKPSAFQVALLRAAHQVLDVPPVFEDPLARRLAGSERVQALLDDPGRHGSSLHRGLRASTAARARLAEDEWARARAGGVRQYVILGSGLDTFAYRDTLRDGSTVFEADLPAMLAWKRAMLRAAGIAEPDHVVYAPVDFTRGRLIASLESSGFRAGERSLVAWLGVSMYLERDAVAGVLGEVARLARGGALVFDYAADPERLSPRERAARERLASGAAARGEPWLSAFTPEAMAELLGGLGYGEVADFGPEAINARYFAGRADGLRKGGVSRLVCARVGGQGGSLAVPA